MIFVEHNFLNKFVSSSFGVLKKISKGKVNNVIYKDSPNANKTFATFIVDECPKQQVEVLDRSKASERQGEVRVYLKDTQFQQYNKTIILFIFFQNQGDVHQVKWWQSWGKGKSRRHVVRYCCQ